MKKLVLGSLFALAALPAAGCVVHSGPSGDEAHVQASWQLVTANPDGSSTPQACPAGVTTAAVYSQQVDGTSLAPIGQPFIDLFDCVDGTDITSHLPPGYYDEWVALTDDGGTEYAESAHTLQDTPDLPLDLTVADMPYGMTVVGNGGQFELTWHLVGAQSGSMVDCTTAGANDPGDSGVEAIATVTGTQMAFDDKYFCDNPKTNLTDPLLPGNYTISVDAYNPNGALGQPQNMTGDIIDPAQDPTKPVTDLGEIALPIDGL